MKDEAETIEDVSSESAFVKCYRSGGRRADDSGKIRTIGVDSVTLILGAAWFWYQETTAHTQTHSGSMMGIKRAFTYKALNKLIQGSAADMTKQSMLVLYQKE